MASAGAGRTMTVDVAPEIVDRLMAFYCDWREECLETHDAYERFKVAAPADRNLAFAAYEAALDREEAASALYAGQIRQITRGALTNGTAVGRTTPSAFP